MILVPIAWVQLLVIAGGAMLGFTLPKPELPQGTSTAAKVSSFTVGIGWAILIGAVILPITLSYALGAAGGEASPLAVYAAFAQTGSLVFGGGHVVLPLLQAEVVGPGWMSDPQFLAGYGVTQAMPGPIFTLSAFLGAITGANLGAGWLPFFGFGGLALLGIFAPSFGLVAGLLPLWDRMRALVRVRQALLGVNAAVVGLLLAALYDPVWTKAVAVDAPAQAVAIVIGSWLVLSVWRWPAWLVVALAAAVGTAMQL
jgi:chromate transporter